MKQLVRDVFQTFGLDIGRFRSRRSLEGFLQVLFDAYAINVVIDVGANVGQYAEKVRHLGFKGRLVSFEPIPKTFSKLSKNLSHDLNWIGFNKALGYETAEVKMFYEPEQTDMASLYGSSPCVPDIFQRWAVAEKEQIIVQMERLDDVFSNCVGNIVQPNVFLKCDTQGHDLEVLRGAGKSLAQVRAVQIEVPIVHLYSNSRNFGEIMNTLKDMNFIPCAFYPVTTTGEEGISVLEFDCIAIRPT